MMQLLPFGKFLNVEVKEEKSTEVAEGEVISQEPEAGNWEDPDNVKCCDHSKYRRSGTFGSE